MSADRLDELIAQAALGELTDAEERELDGLLAADADASAELRSALDVAAAVQATLAEPPPSSLRDRVMAATADMPQLPADEPQASVELPATPPSESGLDPGPDPDAGSDAEPGTSAGTISDSNVVDLGARRRRRMTSFIAAAAAALIIVVGGAVVVSNDRGGGDQIAAVRDADDVQAHRLTGELEGLTVLYSPSEQALVVEGVGVRSPNGTNDFELWLVGGPAAIPVGVFRPGDDGRVERRFDDVDPTGFVLGVTEEPAGGSDIPTLPVLAASA